MANPKKPKAKSNRGGPRSNSGRKPKVVNTIRAQIAQDKSGILAGVEGQIIDFLPRAIANLILLANGGYERVEEKWTRDPVPDKPGVLWDDQPLVLTERKVTLAEPDRGANQYLVDRALGKAIQRLAHDFGDLSDEELLARIQGLAGGGSEAGAAPSGS